MCTCVKEVYATSDGRLLMRGRLQSVRRARCSVGLLAPVEPVSQSVSESVYCRESAVRLVVHVSAMVTASPLPACTAGYLLSVPYRQPCPAAPALRLSTSSSTFYSHSQWRRQGGGGKLPAYGWTSKNYVICVCFRCHGTSSYHTTDTLQGRRAKSHVDTQTVQPGLGDFVLQTPYRPIPHFPPVTKSWRRH